MANNEMINANTGEVLTITPRMRIDNSREVSKILGAEIERLKLYEEIAGNKFPTVDAWTLLANLAECVLIQDDLKKLDDGAWLATITVYDSAGNRRGNGMGLAGGPTDKRFAARPDNEKISMASVRATRAACRKTLGFILSLAGFHVGEPEDGAAFDENIARIARIQTGLAMCGKNETDICHHMGVDSIHAIKDLDKAYKVVREWYAQKQAETMTVVTGDD